MSRWKAYQDSKEMGSGSAERAAGLLVLPSFGIRLVLETTRSHQCNYSSVFINPRHALTVERAELANPAARVTVSGNVKESHVINLVRCQRDGGTDLCTANERWAHGGMPRLLFAGAAGAARGACEPAL